MWYDRVTGLYNARNRLYNPPFARFNQRDPNGQALALATTLARNAQTMSAFASLSPGVQYTDGMHLYQFTGGNPVNRTDPSGLYYDTWDEVEDIAAEYYAGRAAHQIEVVAQAQVLFRGVQAVLKGMAKRILLETAATMVCPYAPYGFAAWDTAQAFTFMVKHGVSWGAVGGLAANLYAAKVSLDVGPALGIKMLKGQKRSAGLGLDVPHWRFSNYARRNENAYRTGCFRAGTMVVMADASLMPIEDVSVGDEMLCPVVPGSIANAACRVRSVHERTSDHYLAVTVGDLDGTLDVSEEHPMWVVGRGWTLARDIREEDSILSRDGRSIAVRSVKVVPKPATVYNLTVGGSETYYVTSTGLLVHNKPWQINPIGPVPKFTKGMKARATVIARGKGIDKANVLVQRYGGQTKKWRKMKTTADDGFEVHWYEHQGIGKVGIKWAGEPDPF